MLYRGSMSHADPVPKFSAAVSKTFTLPTFALGMSRLYLFTFELSDRDSSPLCLLLRLPRLLWREDGSPRFDFANKPMTGSRNTLQPKPVSQPNTKRRHGKNGVGKRSQTSADFLQLPLQRRQSLLCHRSIRLFSLSSILEPTNMIMMWHPPPLLLSILTT